MTTQVLVLDHTKLAAARGRRTLREVAEASGGHFSVQQLCAYEKGHYRPKQEAVPILLEALGVEFEQVASPFPALQADRERTAARQSTERP